MGSLFGAKLSQNKDNEVFLVDVWKEHIDLINERGLLVHEGDEVLKFKRVKGLLDSKKAGVCDLVVIFVKSTLTESAVKEKSEVDEKQQMMAVYDEIDAIMERGRGKYKDFNQLVLNNSLPITESMTEAILQSEVADDLMYYLGSNPAITEKLSKLSPFKAAAEIGKIEAKLTTKVDPVPEVRKRATSAPDPITPIRTTGVTDKDPAAMTPKEYRAWRERNK